MSGTKLFNPSESLSIRPPTSNARYHGNICNPPRYAELGGLSSAAKGDQRSSEMNIQLPGSTQRKVPQASTAKNYR